MNKNMENKQENPEILNEDKNIDPNKEENKKLNLEDKLKEAEDRALRSLAEIENQRRRFEKEIKEAFDYGGFNFAKETVSILDSFLLVLAIAFSNSKSPLFLIPLTIKLAPNFLQKSIVKPS